MSTIDNLDLKIYDAYAKRTQVVEQFTRQVNLQEASSIPPQIQLVDFYPKMTELDLLFGVIPYQSPSWAFFSPPSKYRFQRRSPFGFFRVAPSLGTFDKEEEDQRKLLDLVTESEEEEREKKTLKRCFTQISKINEWLSFIVGRVGQFLQG